MNFDDWFKKRDESIRWTCKLPSRSKFVWALRNVFSYGIGAWTRTMHSMRNQSYTLLWGRNLKSHFCLWMIPSGGQNSKGWTRSENKKSSSERIHSKTNETGFWEYKNFQISSFRHSFKIRNLASYSTESIPFPENKRSESKLNPK